MRENVPETATLTLDIRDEKAWCETVAHGKPLLIDSKDSAENVLKLIDADLQKPLPKRVRAKKLLAKAKFLNQLGRLPQMNRAAQKSWILIKTSEAAQVLADSFWLLGKTKEACKFYQKAFELPHTDEAIDSNYAFALINLGRWCDAWDILRRIRWGTVKFLKESGWRFQEWDGSPCKKLHIFCEDGRGDIICSLRHLDQIKARGVEQIAVCVPPTLEPDFAAFLQTQTWIPEVINLPADPTERCRILEQVECAIGTGDLLHILNVLPEQVPAPAPWAATPEHISKYKHLRRGKPVIGICWAAGQLESAWADEGARRSLTAEQVSTTVQKMDGVDWVSLQFGKTPPIPEIISPELKSWSDTAGILANLDALVSVDTATMHLALGMGVPTFVICSTVVDWRLAYGHLWYPQAKLFRSRRFGFDDSVKQLIAELQAEFGTVQKMDEEKR